MPVVAQGGSVVLRALYRNGVGQPADATNVALDLRDPDGIVQYGPLVIPPVVDEPGVGEYSYTWAVPLSEILGTWTAEWSGIVAGAGVSGFEYVEVVLAGSIGTGPFEFLVKPDDYESIRHVLGVTALDVTDDHIENPIFGPQAEARVKRAVPDWSALLPDPDALIWLRTATVYATAALIAESMARGGFIGLMRPQIGDRDWMADSRLYWSHFNEWVASANPTGTLYDLPMVRVARGQSTTDDRGKAAPAWADGYPAQWGGWRE